MNIKKIRGDFHLLNKGKKVVYFDNACVTLKPKQVIDKMNEYYLDYPACSGRSNHRLAKRVASEVAIARKEIAKFFSAKRDSEIIFTRNATEGINLVAKSLNLKKGDRVLLSDKEHNSNLVPWLNLKKQGVRVDNFEFGNLEDFKKKIKGAKIASVVQTSNIDGTSQDVKEMAKIAHANKALIMVDAAQSAPHKEVNVRKLDVDFMVCSGHKMLGPSGIGVLYGKQKTLEKLNPFMLGGETVKNTTYNSFDIGKLPSRFEAGLQNYSGIVGFGEAVKYLKRVGLSNIEKYESKLNKKLTEGLAELGVKILGAGDYKLRSGIVSFLCGLDVDDVSLMLDNHGIMTRSGMHCAHSWFNANGLKGSSRASFYLYNTLEEVDYMLNKMEKIVKLG